MAHVLALAGNPIRFAPAQMVRALLVLGCALALIMAGQPIPMLGG